MIDVLIFSKDRAAQLDLLLRSINKYAPDLYSSVSVLWTASDPTYEAGYRRCMVESSNVVWQREWTFHSNVTYWLRERTGPVISFLCDDDVFYRKAEWGGWTPWSLRGGDYDYLFSVDGNVYDRAQIIALLDGLRFRDPTELEHQGHLHRYRFPFYWLTTDPNLACLVGIPANRVSRSSGMPHMGVHEYDLNERYLAGDRLSLSTIESDRILPAHMNLAYAWEPRAAAA